MHTGPSLFIYAVVCVLAYFIGGMPFGYLFVRYSLGRDIRTMGSGNIGATNVHRTAGTKAGLIVLLLDIGKGFLAVWLAALLTDKDALGVGLAAVAVTVGHCYPAVLRFKGGKAVACYVGAFLYIAPMALLVMFFVFVLVVAVSKFVSLGSIVGALLFPLPVWALHADPAIVAASACSSLLIVYRHKGNIERLRNGTENKFSLKGAKT